MRRWLLILLLALVPAVVWAQDGHDHGHSHGHDHSQHQSEAPEQAQAPKAAEVGDTVEVYYVVRKEDNTLVDATRKGKPFKFQVGQAGVIPGFSVAVVGMKPGEKKQVSIPPHLHYGENVPGLEGNLLFDIEVVSVRSAEQMLQELAEKEGEEAAHSRENLPAMMVFLMDNFFAQPWLDPEKRDTATQHVLLSAAKVFAILLVLFGIGWARRRRDEAR